MPDCPHEIRHQFQRPPSTPQGCQGQPEQIGHAGGLLLILEPTPQGKREGGAGQGEGEDHQNQRDQVSSEIDPGHNPDREDDAVLQGAERESAEDLAAEQLAPRDGHRRQALQGPLSLFAHQNAHSAQHSEQRKHRPHARHRLPESTDIRGRAGIGRFACASHEIHSGRALIPELDSSGVDPLGVTIVGKRAWQNR